MKKITLFIFSLLIFASLFSQKTYRAMGWKFSRDIPLNEIKVNLPWTIFASYPEISYERILNSDISVGATLGVGFDTDRYPYEYAFTPYFRWFFGGNRESMQQYATGFFIEANSSVYSQVMETSSVPDANEVSELGAGLGLVIGHSAYQHYPEHRLREIESKVECPEFVKRNGGIPEFSQSSINPRNHKTNAGRVGKESFRQGL